MSDAEKLARYEAALRVMADAENWLGNPKSIESSLCAHFTPYELAVNALAGEDVY